MSSIVTITLQSIYYKIFCQQLPLLSPSLRTPLFIDRKEPALINAELKQIHRNLRTTSVPASLVFHHAMPRHATQPPPYVELMQKCTNEVEEKTMHARKAEKGFSAPFSNGSRGKRYFFFFGGSNYHMPDGGISEQTWLDLTDL
jgi:hypothetical protein